MVDRILKYLNLVLVVLYPVAWFAPLVQAGLLPLFGMDQISIASGILSLFEKDPFLALVILCFAVIAPMVKTWATVIDDFINKPLIPKWIATALARLAMADLFLIALYITVAKGIGVGRIETRWGLYLFSFCVFISVINTLKPSKKSL